MHVFFAVVKGRAMLATLLLSGADEMLIGARTADHPLVSCQSPAELTHALTHARANLVVADIARLHGFAVPRMERPVSFMILARRPDAATARQLQRLVCSDAMVEIESESAARLAESVLRRLSALPAETPQTAMFDTMRDVVPRGALRFVMATAVLGYKRQRVSVVAKWCCVSERTLERRLAAGALPPARTLLSWSLAIHSAWRLEALDWSAKRVAASAELSSVAALSKHLSHHFARGISKIREQGFEQTLAEYRLALLARDRKGAVMEHSIG